jgi:RNA-binding protein
LKLTSQQRKYLESIANQLDAVVRIGKNGLEAKIVSSINDAFNSSELIKIKILDSAPVEAEEVAEAVLKPTKASLVRIIGRVLILYKPFTEKPPRIILPESR